MLRNREVGKRGFTLTELIVVLAIGAVLTALALPAISNMGSNSRNEFKGAAREIFTLLSAARIYATTNNVDAAVVYALDNYQPLDVNPGNTDGLRSPFIDSLSGQMVRCITSAAIMYKLPDASGPYATGWAPAPGDQGIFRPVLGGMVIPLEISKDYEGETRDANIMRYAVTTPRPGTNFQDLRAAAVLGLQPIPVYTEGFGPLVLPGSPDPDGPDPIFESPLNGALTPTPDLGDPNDPYNVEVFLAHVFTKNGELQVDNSSKERFTFFITHPPDAPRDERVSETVDDNNAPVVRINTVQLEISKSSGRIRISTRD